MLIASAPETIPTSDPAPLAQAAKKLECPSDPAVATARRSLEGHVLYYTHVEGDLDCVLEHLRDVSGLSIVVDSRVRDSVDLTRATRFDAHGVLLGDALESLCSAYGLTCKLTEEVVVLVTVQIDEMLVQVSPDTERYTFGSDDLEPDGY